MEDIQNAMNSLEITLIRHGSEGLIEDVFSDKTLKTAIKALVSVSDGYHTFDELYFHRMRLFSIICKQNKEKAWKSKLHDDGTMYENYFIVGITTDKGDYSYHYHMEYWGHFEGVKELDKAPKWDGHKPEDIGRLDSLI